MCPLTAHGQMVFLNPSLMPPPIAHKENFSQKNKAENFKGSSPSVVLPGAPPHARAVPTWRGLQPSCHPVGDRQLVPFPREAELHETQTHQLEEETGAAPYPGLFPCPENPYFIRWPRKERCQSKEHINVLRGRQKDAQPTDSAHAHSLTDFLP